MARRPNLNFKPLDSSAGKSRFISRGGDKLRGALDAFGITVQGKVCLDVGSSHGGFTDCLLQAGAQAVYCVDVGYGLLDYKLRKDPRVRLLERTNFRFFDPSTLHEKVMFVTADVSFISLSKIFPKISEILAVGSEALALVKPQFEGTPKEVPGGFVKDESTRQMILARIKTLAKESGYTVKNIADSVVAGRKGNQETFFHLIKI